MANIVALIIEGLRRYVPEAMPPNADLKLLDGDESGVALEPYRALLDQVYRRGGGRAILQAGRSLEHLTDPILFVLLNSDSVPLVIEKEARLARFIHSRHELRIVEMGRTSMELEHVSTVADPPRLTENLASAGLHITLFEQVGCRGLRLRFPLSPEPERWVYGDSVYDEPPPTGCQRWVFSWRAFTPTRRPMPGLDELLLGDPSRGPLGELSSTSQAVDRLVRGDLGRTWTVADIAEGLSTSPRSLQRALAAESTSLSDLVEQIRVAEAKRLLASTALSVTEIGYVCGFADTSHFSRRFKGRVGASPSKYRDGL